MQLTQWNSKVNWAIEIADHINEDYPNQASVKFNEKGSSAIFITRVHAEYCERYVQDKCRVKNEN